MSRNAKAYEKLYPKCLGLLSGVQRCRQGVARSTDIGNEIIFCKNRETY